MKKFSLLSAALVAAMGANAQLMVDWNDEGQYTFHAEDFIGEGSISWDEDEAAFVCDGTGEGKIMLNLEGKTIDFSEVASFSVKGTYQLDGADPVELVGGWGEEGNADPLATLLINDAISGQVNEWFGSRYNVDYAAKADKGEYAGEPYYSLSTKIDAFYFTARTILEGEGEEAVVTGSVPGIVIIDEIVLTKLKEKDPEAISLDMWHNWTNWDATAEIDAEKPFYGEDNVGKNIGGGAVVLGTGNVLGCEFADLTGYAGIYIKGTPGMSLRLLFNRPSLEGGSTVCTECNPVCDENGECKFMFETDLFNVQTRTFDADGMQINDADGNPIMATFKDLFDYVHLNCVKSPWTLPEGEESIKVQKFNFIEKGQGGSVDAINGAQAADVIYNVYGQRVDESYRGIVIKNGKKFINK